MSLVKYYSQGKNYDSIMDFFQDEHLHLISLCVPV